jgi:endonuclease/exonuclease/phosphatase family metal-dependent hydrolase
LRVLTWNLYHGRSIPPAGRELTSQFARLLACWGWDAALLQEVPPWWPQQLARAAGAEQRLALTSRNGGLAIRRALAERWPDLIKSNGGGCNATLVRGSIIEHRALRLRVWPERRVAQFVRLASGECVVNFHASADATRAQDELARLCSRALAWAGEAPLVLGGDLNLRSPLVLPNGLVHAAERDVDHLLVRGLQPAGASERLDRGVSLDARRIELSDHVPLALGLRRPDER